MRPVTVVKRFVSPLGGACLVPGGLQQEFGQACCLCGASQGWPAPCHAAMLQLLRRMRCWWWGGRAAWARVAWGQGGEERVLSWRGRGATIIYATGRGSCLQPGAWCHGARRESPLPAPAAARLHICRPRTCGGEGWWVAPVSRTERGRPCQAARLAVTQQATSPFDSVRNLQHGSAAPQPPTRAPRRARPNGRRATGR